MVNTFKCNDSVCLFYNNIMKHYRANTQCAALALQVSQKQCCWQTSVVYAMHALATDLQE